MMSAGLGTFYTLIVDSQLGVATLANRVIKMRKFGSQDSQHSPWKGLPQMAPWHHVGATMEITLDKKGSLYDPAGTESWNMQTSLDR